QNPLTRTGLEREVAILSMADLFAESENATGTAAAVHKAEPLAARMRPRTLDEYAGQEHILGPGKLLRPENVLLACVFIQGARAHAGGERLGLVNGGRGPGG